MLCAESGSSHSRQARRRFSWQLIELSLQSKSRLQQLLNNPAHTDLRTSRIFHLIPVDCCFLSEFHGRKAQRSITEDNGQDEVYTKIKGSRLPA